MQVRIRRSGTQVPVQSLVIGDLLYDPICDNYSEVIDILSRDSVGLGHRLVRIGANTLGQASPSEDILVSRQQPVARSDRPSATGPLRIAFGPAHQLGEELQLETKLFAIFPERPCCISVAGAFLRLVDPSALAQVAPSGLDLK
jgi:hypothetical protein